MAFDFYFAGSQHKSSTELMCDLGCNILRSFVNDKKSINELIALKKSNKWTGKLLIDSGAFTVHRKGGTLDVDSYINWLNDNMDYIDYAIQIDDIPGKWGEVKTPEQIKQSPINTWNNYLYMTSKLKCPTKLLPVFHQHENYKYLKTIVNHKINGEYIPYICISGNKELTSAQRKKFYSECYDVIKRSENPNVKVHCLGSATLSDITDFPFTSSDATTWLMQGANGTIITDYGSIIVSESQKDNPEYIGNQPLNVQNKIKEFCNEYNIDFDSLKSNYYTRSNFNIHYFYNKSRELEFKPRNLLIRKLF